MISAQRRALSRTGRIGGAALILLGTATLAQGEMRNNPLKLPNTQIEPIVWAQIDGWADDDHDAAFATFLLSCKAIRSDTEPTRAARPMYRALYDVCGKALEAKPHKPGEARTFFEQNFHPVRISPLGDPDGFLTGYYEPIAAGVRQPVDGFNYPLYRKPANLLPGGRMAVSTLARVHEGKKRAHKRKLVPYYERAAIDDGALKGRNLEICWLKDPIDAFFAHIQGSVRVRLDDGEMLRLNYEAANGHPYYAVGRYLIDRNIVPKDEMSMDRIREWMERHPKQGDELRRMNKSYVFFRQTSLANNEEPIGAQGISLTPGRSIAVDRKLHVYGTPFFISAMLPIESLKPETPFRRLMIAQDTGGAIVGPARADIYFGAGDEAGSVSGRLRHPGRFVMLVPNGIPTGGTEVPLPRPRPPMLVPESDKAKPPVAAKAEDRVAAVADTVKPGRPEADKSAVRTSAGLKHKSKTTEAKPKKAGLDKSASRKSAALHDKAKAAETKKPEPKMPEVKRKVTAKPADKKTKSAGFDLKAILTKIAAPEPAKPGKKGASRHKPKS